MSSHAGFCASPWVTLWTSLLQSNGNGQKKTKLVEEGSVLMMLCQDTHALTWNWMSALAVGIWRLGTWAMLRP